MSSQKLPDELILYISREFDNITFWKFSATSKKIQQQTMLDKQKRYQSVLVELRNTKLKKIHTKLMRIQSILDEFYEFYNNFYQFNIVFSIVNIIFILLDYFVRRKINTLRDLFYIGRFITCQYLSIVLTIYALYKAQYFRFQKIAEKKGKVILQICEFDKKYQNLFKNNGMIHYYT